MKCRLLALGRIPAPSPNPPVLSQDIGAPFEAIDPDKNETLTYTLAGDDAAHFTLVEESGQLQTKERLGFRVQTQPYRDRISQRREGLQAATPILRRTMR